MYLKLTMEPKAYAQWVAPKIFNNFRSGSIHVRNATLLSYVLITWLSQSVSNFANLAARGKFHETDHKDVDISIASVSAIAIPSGGNSSVSASGRSNTTSGTEGTIDLFDHELETKICTVYWNCPWESKSNNFEIRNRASKYQVTVGPWNKGSGALGNVDIKVERLD